MAVRILSVLAGLLGVAAAQRAAKPMQMHPFELGDRLARYEVAEPQRGGTKAAERFVAILGGLLLGEPRLESGNVQFLNREQGLLLVRGDAEQIALANRVLEEVQKDEPARARLQCSFVALPLPVAKEHGLKAGVVVATDEITVGRLVKDATKHKGTLLNVPEVAVRTLTPFVIDATGKASGAAAAPGPAPLRLRGEMVPVGGGEVAVALQVVRGSLPADVTRRPDDALLQALVRLQTGKSAMAMVVEGDTATVLIVRCVDVASEPLPPARR